MAPTMTLSWAAQPPRTQPPRMPLKGWHAAVGTEEQRLPMREAGTGGTTSLRYYLMDDFGYSGRWAREMTIAEALLEPAQDEPAPESPSARQMELVRAVFGRTMSRLPAALGVSRQTLYNWLAGETPKAEHQARLERLAAAASAFQLAGFKLTAPMLDRTLTQGKSFLELMADGADGAETAQRLMRVINRGAASLAKLDALLGGRRAPIGPEDFGASPSTGE